jgi:hypothetical protein
MIEQRPCSKKTAGSVVMNREDLTGRRSGLLTVISGKNGRWECRCDCGGFKTAGASELIKGRLKSCGCLMSFSQTKRMELLAEAKAQEAKAQEAKAQEDSAEGLAAKTIAFLRSAPGARFVMNLRGFNIDDEEFIAKAAVQKAVRDLTAAQINGALPQVRAFMEGNV